MQLDVRTQLDDVAACFPNLRVDTIFDVGANVGQSAMEFLKKCPYARIHCFEPTPESFLKLKENLSGQPSIFLNNIGLSDKSGKETFHFSGTSTMNRISPKGGGNITLEITTIDEYCSTNNIPIIDYLKIDTEGHELSVLTGSENTLINVKFVEAEASMNPHNKCHNSFIDIYRFLTERNFHLFGIYEQIREWSGGGVPIMRRSNPVFVNSSIVGNLPSSVIAG